jgi:predicted ribosome quality control (RQC) complex YloA/Tae2 family protein
MEKTEITSLDLRFLVKELRQALTGGVFRKIYQYRSKIEGRPVNQFLFEIFVPDHGDYLLYVDDRKLFLTKNKKAVPQEPPNFCMFLRKHILNKRILMIEQNNFDRVLRFSTGDNTLIFEFFSDGNVILCDSMNNIIMPLEIQKWAYREIKPKVPYRYPPQQADPFTLDLDDFKKVVRKSDRSCVVLLAATLGLGSGYANEVCFRAKIDPNTPCIRLGSEEISGLFSIVQAIGSAKPDYHVYDNYVSPFKMESLGKEPTAKTTFFSEALDNFFSSQIIDVENKQEIKQFEQKMERMENILEKQDVAKEKWERVEKESKESADAIYNYYQLVRGALNGIKAARDMNISWEDIRTRVRSETTPEAEAIKEIREGDGVMVMELAGRDVEIDLRKSVEENAAKYYEDAKWARKKMEGAETAIKDQHKKIDVLQRPEPVKTEVEKEYDLAEKAFEHEMNAMGMTNIKLDESEEAEPEKDSEEPEPEEAEEEPAKEPEFERAATIDMFAQPAEESEETEEPAPRVHEKWYEKFKWFLSSDGLLVIAGKDADQNEEIVRKYTESGDFVFHADIQGAAFTVIKSQGQQVSEQAKKEAAEFAAANSKAWAKGLGNIDVYSVPRAQVTKTPPSGGRLPKGSFMIIGEREWYKKTELKLSVGVRVDQETNTAGVVAGPLMSIRKNAKYFVTIKPGFKKSAELARLIKNKILIKAKPEDKFLIERLSLEEFQKTVPSGMGEISEYA